jgi:hypothetical protein
MLSWEDTWKSETLDHVFNALAVSPELSERLVYKGARVLRLLLNEATRASLDIDASFANIAANVSVSEKDLEHLRALASTAITACFESQEPVRFTLERTTIANRRRSGEHPRGWNVYWLDLEVRDMTARNTLGAIPSLRIEIASPELLSEHSISPIDLNGHQVNAVTLQRMAGEKLRAFLSSLPAYRNKLRLKIHPPRAKDLYDLARILRKRPLKDHIFWRISGGEFFLACKSRYIDCEGIQTFQEAWGNTQAAYTADPTIPNDVPCSEATSSLEQIVASMAKMELFPFSFELPADILDGGANQD